MLKVGGRGMAKRKEKNECFLSLSVNDFRLFHFIFLFNALEHLHLSFVTRLQMPVLMSPLKWDLTRGSAGCP